MKTKTHPQDTTYYVESKGPMSPCGTRVQGNPKRSLWKFKVNYMGYVSSEEFMGGDDIFKSMPSKTIIQEEQFRQLIFRGATKINEDKPKNRKRIDITIPASMIEFLTREGQIRQCSKSAVIEEALTEYIERKKK